VIDRRVERAKFDSELQALQACAPLLEARGCSIAKAEFPTVDVLFTPRWPPEVVVVAPDGSRLLRQPLPGAVPRAFGARIDFSGFDVLALSVSFRNPNSWDPLPVGAIGGFHCAPGELPVAVVHPHPKTGLAFLCVQGVREYHEQPIHEGDDWLLYRGSCGLPYVVEAIWKTCVMSARPVLIPAANGPLLRYAPVTA